MGIKQYLYRFRWKTVLEITKGVMGMSTKKILIIAIVIIAAIAIFTSDSSSPAQPAATAAPTAAPTAKPTAAPTKKPSSNTSKPSSYKKKTTTTTSSGSSSSSNPYGYGDPKPGESLVDYIKREDPGLYNDMKKNYESMISGW